MKFLERAAVTLRRTTPISPNHPMWRAIRPVYRQLLVRAGKNGLERRINGTDALLVVPELYTLGEIYEPPVWQQIMRELRPDDTVIDAGASVGLYTIAIARRLGPQGHVIAFEADPNSAETLTRMVEINGVGSLVTVYNQAVGDSTGTVRFIQGRGLESRVALEEDTASAQVPVVKLDDVFESKRVDILKLDVEGYELHALRGAARLLADPDRAPRALFVEVHPLVWDRFGVTSEMLLQLLASCGYEVCDLDGKHVKVIEDYGEVIATKKPVRGCAAPRGDWSPA